MTAAGTARATRVGAGRRCTCCASSSRTGDFDTSLTFTVGSRVVLRVLRCRFWSYWSYWSYWGGQFLLGFRRESFDREWSGYFWIGCSLAGGCLFIGCKFLALMQFGIPQNLFHFSVLFDYFGVIFFVVFTGAAAAATATATATRGTATGTGRHDGGMEGVQRKSAADLM